LVPPPSTCRYISVTAFPCFCLKLNVVGVYII
jgi:hypothetical protein